MTPKNVKFVLGQIECATTYKIVSEYVKGLEELLALQQEEIQMLRHEIDSLEYSLSNERCL